MRLNDVVVSNTKTGEAHRISLSTRSHIHSAVFVRVRQATYLVVASSIGVQVWSQDGMVLKYFLPLNSVVTGESGDYKSASVRFTFNAKLRCCLFDVCLQS